MRSDSDSDSDSGDGDSDAVNPCVVPTYHS